MSSTSLFPLTVAESSLVIKMGFLRRYFGITAVQFIFISFICNVIMLCPTARFYITENDWLLWLFCFLFCASYISLLNVIKLPVISILFCLHVGILSVTITVIVTYYDLMFLLQAILLQTCIICVLFLYTLQSKMDFNIWTIIFITFICIFSGSGSLNVLFGGTEEDNILSIFFTILLLIYHSYGISKISRILTPTDYFLAVVKLHLLPVNSLSIFSNVNNSGS